MHIKKLTLFLLLLIVLFTSGCITSISEKYVSPIPLDDTVPCNDIFETFEEYINTNPC